MKSPRCSGRFPLFAGLVVMLVSFPMEARTQDAQFQTFFASVCAGAPSGGLAARCAETTGGSGNISGDSENSLNPSQLVTSGEAALFRAAANGRAIEERLESKRAEAPSAKEGKFSLFFQVRPTIFDRDRTDRERVIDGTTFSSQIGLDYWVNERVLIGALLGYDESDSEFDSDQPGTNFTPSSDEGSSDSDSWSLALFSSVNLTDALWVDGALGYTRTEYEFKRRVVFQESNRVVPQTNVSTFADPDGGYAFASLGVGYRWRQAPASYGVYVRGNYARSWIESFRERDATGSGLGMRSKRQTRDSFQGRIGVHGSYALSTMRAVWLPQLRAEYVREFRREGDTTAAYLLDTAGLGFDVDAEDPDRNYFELGLAVSGTFPNGWIAFVDYQVQLGYRDLSRQVLALGLRIEF